MFNISTRKVCRNGLIFQVPTSIFSNQRFTVHPDGTGTSWDEAAPDIDQPHGLDYRSHQDLRKGIRKRMEFEHADFADSTVGGIHLPGGCAVLGIEDGTATILADGTLKGHGLVWDNTARIWCSTATAGASTTGDWTLVQIHPDKQWGGKDVTWTGIHEFDESVDFTAVVNFDGDVSIAGDVNLAGDVTIDGTTVLTGTFLDGTTTFNPVAGESGPTFKILGDWSARSNNTTYTARTDGQVHAFGNTGTSLLKGYTPSGTLRAWDDPAGIAGGGKSITMLVKGGDTWDVSGADTVYWIPFGDNT